MRARNWRWRRWHGRQASATTREVGGVKLMARVVTGIDMRDLKGLADEAKKTLGSGVVALVGVGEDGKAGLVVAVTQDLTSRLNAVDLVRAGAAVLGGKGGGGRPDMAQAGGPDGAKAEDALAAVASALSEGLDSSPDRWRRARALIRRRRHGGGPDTRTHCGLHGQHRRTFRANGGSFDGMSQSGVLLVLRNSGSADCLMPGLPKLRFDDAAGHRLDVLREPPPGMHPGPVVTPLVLSPGAAAAAALAWVSGDVYGGHHCVTPAEVVIGEGPDAPTALWRSGQLRGEPGRAISFRQAVLRVGPVPATLTSHSDTAPCLVQDDDRKRSGRRRRDVATKRN